MHLGYFACAEEALTWMWSCGLQAFFRSPSGAMLERQHAMRVVYRPSAELVRERFDRAARIRATGLHEPPVGGITAQPTAEFVSSSREPPNDADLVRFGAVSSHREKVKAHSSLAVEALDLAFGAEGARWSWSEQGRAVALFPLVPAGIALIAGAKAAELCGRCKHARRRHVTVYVTPRESWCCAGKGCACGEFVATLELSDADRLNVAVQVDQVTGGSDRERRGLIVRAKREAEELLANALATWTRLA
jgi:hypothetical protein